jgi:50S ribosomal subunit-associated GTPase HflX
MTDEERAELKERMVSARKAHLEHMRTTVIMVSEIIDKIDRVPEEERLRYISAAFKGLILLSARVEERIGKIMTLLEDLTDKPKDKE